MPPKGRTTASPRRPSGGPYADGAGPAPANASANTTPRTGRPNIVEVGAVPKRSRSAPSPVRQVGTHMNTVRALRRTSNLEDGPDEAEDTPGADTGSARQPKPNAHQRVYSTWNKLQMGDQSNFLHQHARSIEGVLPKGAQPKKTGPWTMPEVETIQVEDAYTGPRMAWPFGWSEVMALVQFYKKDLNAVLHRRYAIQILLQAKEVLENTVTSALVELELRSGQTLNICGDTHGQLADVLWVFHLHGYPSERNLYLFNGDIADRGENAVQIFLLLFAIMLVDPSCVFLSRGNHEDMEMNELPLFAGGGFAKEVRRKYGGRTFSLFQEVFDRLPLAYVVNGELLVVHGGLPRHAGVRLEHIRSLDYRIQPPVPDNYPHSIFFDLLWADPKASDGIGPSRRGPFCINFGPDVTHRFLDDNKLAVCVRSHEVPTTMRGFEVKHDQRLITVFSASNYCGSTGNFGAVLRFRLKTDAAPALDSARELLPGTLRAGSADDSALSPPVSPNGTGRGKGSPRGKGGRALAHHLPPLTLGGRGPGMVRPLGLGGPTMAPLSAQALHLPRLQTMDCTAHEHWAPALAEFPSEAASSLIELAQEQRIAAERAASSTPRGHQKMKAEILEKVRVKIVERRQELLWHYLHRDRTESARITLQEWQEGLEAVLQLDIPWLEFRNDLVIVDSDDCVDYRRFLNRFRIGVGRCDEQWPAAQGAHGAQLYEALMRADLQVDEVLRIFNGTMTEVGLATVLRRAEMPEAVTLQQVTDMVALVREMGTAGAGAGDSKAPLQPEELLALFVVMFEPAVPEEPGSPTEDPALADQQPQALPFPGDFLKTFQDSGRTAVQLFREFDTGQTGYLSQADFVAGMQRLWRQSHQRELKLNHCPSPEEFRALAEALDPHHRGHIALVQFCRAFYAKDSTGAAADTLMQQLYTILYENAVTLRRACRFYDDDEDGVVSVQEFKEALGALNALLFQKGHPFSPLHTALIAVHGCRNAAGTVKYVDFFDSFAVVDAETSPKASARRGSAGASPRTFPLPRSASS